MDNPLVKRIRDVGLESVYLGSSRDELKHEIAENCWSVLASNDECRNTTIEEIMGAFDEVVEHRRTQVINQADDKGAIFYIWFDEQACHLSCCLISGHHSSLPFGCEITYVSSAVPIVECFLSSPIHDGIPWTALEDVEFDDNECERSEPLQVYTVRLP